jgi:hypothetical protein
VCRCAKRKAYALFSCTAPHERSVGHRGLVRSLPAVGARCVEEDAVHHALPRALPGRFRPQYFMTRTGVTWVDLSRDGPIPSMATAVLTCGSSQMASCWSGSAASSLTRSADTPRVSMQANHSQIMCVPPHSTRPAPVKKTITRECGGGKGAAPDDSFMIRTADEMRINVWESQSLLRF